MESFNEPISLNQKLAAFVQLISLFEQFNLEYSTTKTLWWLTYCTKLCVIARWVEISGSEWTCMELSTEYDKIILY